MPDKHIHKCDLSTNETEAFLLLMHQSARLLNHISVSFKNKWDLFDFSTDAPVQEERLKPDLMIVF